PDAGSTITVDVELGDLWVRPASIDVEPGTAITMNVTNTGAMTHDLKVNGTDGTEMLDPGESETITVGPFSATTEAWCTVPGHREAGMSMDIVVTGAATETTDGGHDGHGEVATGDFAEIDFNAAPG